MKIYQFSELCEKLGVGSPMLMIDRVQVDSTSMTALSLKTLSIDEALFQGHFPREPIFPGVLHILGAVQATEVLLRETDNRCGELVILKEINRYKFRKPVLPGDVIYHAIEVVERNENDLLVSVKVYNGETLASEGRLLVGYADKCYAECVRGIDKTAYDSTVDFKDIKVIRQAIPHRFPFLLLDRITNLETENGVIVGYKNVTGNDAFMSGLTTKMMPNVLLAEAAAQTACAYSLSLPDMGDRLGLFFSIDRAKFYAPVLPGDQARFELVSKSGRVCYAEGKVYVGSELVAEVDMKFVLVDAV